MYLKEEFCKICCYGLKGRFRGKGGEGKKSYSSVCTHKHVKINSV